MSADTRPMTLPIVERLRQEEHGESRFVNRGPTARLRNPDGPEAADTIEELVEVLSELSTHVEVGDLFHAKYLVSERVRPLLAKLGGRQ